MIAFLASKPASYVTAAQYTMVGEWKRESAAVQDVDRTGDERTMKDTRKREKRAMPTQMTTHKTGTREEWLASRRELFRPCGIRLPG